MELESMKMSKCWMKIIETVTFGLLAFKSLCSVFGFVFYVIVLFITIIISKLNLSYTWKNLLSHQC